MMATARSKTRSLSEKRNTPVRRVVPRATSHSKKKPKHLPKLFAYSLSLKKITCLDKRGKNAEAATSGPRSRGRPTASINRGIIAQTTWAPLKSPGAGGPLAQQPPHQKSLQTGKKKVRPCSLAVAALYANIGLSQQ